MNHTLNITANNEASVVERLLQVARYRGYQLAGLELTPLAEKAGLSITLTVSSDKPIHLLTSQLHKLYDVRDLQLASADIAALRA
ncbi:MULTISPECIES: acetolactate synthase 2 small subunit [unclassified Arsukibacterium]|jgi:acetolactate synthase II small subunit|uniref:acetolactate synthase 2 small subunit n=1 Tax=unclassified Arsukibacterium TaxID=2635278 RepID=UPI000C5058B7|nr:MULTISPECIES: acetolactate synthase 2 small subunit [unclassified Arsukibacterium]MAA94559.1 acetolactate synthase 2 small subunit [Rheinheimera sp.]MBM32858.1 acetolactate synthase 2 small subunit [Rheinheimera sp.]MDX1537162.1 acetolactate synthase 2 small subunit [Arsukibacterium sp.]|tara:strand:+ start:40606 stop:40860 length:255 start_codon:yes stop_codon:yes gene_type:complete